MPAESTIDNFEKLSFLAEFLWVPVILPILAILCRFLLNNILYVKEIKKKTCADVEQFISLYNLKISQELRICPEEIVDFVDSTKNKSIEHYLYVCKKKRKIVGFVKFMVSTTSKYIFIAYIAKDENDNLANEKAVKLLLKRLYKKHFKKKDVDKIVIEIEKSKSGNYKTNFSKTISRYAQNYKMESYYIDFEYKQPNMPDDDFNKIPEKCLSLIYVPRYKLNNNLIQKNDLLDIIKSIYFEIYFPSCNKVENSCAAYNNYLIAMLNKYENDLKNYINLHKL